MTDLLNALTGANQTILTIALVLVGVSMSLALLRLLLGVTNFDRILAVNVIGTLTSFLIAALGFASGRPDFLDIALLYTLINFVGTIAILKFLRHPGANSVTPSIKDTPDGMA